MLQSMKHRGPDSTGYALYGPAHGKLVVMRYKLADANDPRDFEFAQRLEHNSGDVEARLARSALKIHEVEQETGYAYRVTFEYDGELKAITDVVEDVPDAEVLSLGHSLEIIKDLGDAESGLQAVPPRRLHGHARDRSCEDGDRVRRGHLGRAPLLGVPVRRRGGRAQRPADELLPVEAPARALRAPVPVRVRLRDDRRVPRREDERGDSLEDAMRESLEELDGVFTYIGVTEDALGVAKDEMAAKPLVLYEADDIVALASEEIAIRAIVDHEIDT